MTPCSFPACGRPVHARGLCMGHYKAKRVGRPLAPLGERSEIPRVVLSLRVSPDVKARALEKPEAARAALERWARRTA